MEFNTMYNAMDRDYYEDLHEMPPPMQKMEEPIISTGDIGTTTTGAQGNLKGMVQAAIRGGVGKIELGLTQNAPGSMGGADGYGNEARTAFRELAQANEVQFTSTHTPVEINGLSGYNPQQQGFSEQMRKHALDEINSAVHFAGDTAQGGAIVVHAGEFMRPISEADWNKIEDTKEGYKRYKFLSNFEEPKNAAFHVVDEKSGRVHETARKDMEIKRPKWKRATEPGVFVEPTGERKEIKPGDPLDYDGRPLPPENIVDRVPIINDNGEFETETIGWKTLEKEAQERGLDKAVYAHQQAAENEIARLKGQALYYSRGYNDLMERREKIKQAMEYYKKIEENIPEEERWKIEVPKPYGELVPPGTQNPSQALEHQFKMVTQELRSMNEHAAQLQTKAEEIRDQMNHIKPVEDYALKESAQTLARAGIQAMQETRNNPHVNRDLFIAYENVDQNLYGGHPDELIKLIKNGRQEMVNQLTKPYIEVNGDKIQNPYYDPKIKKKDAEEYAERHIKALLDTEHLSFWRKQFMPEPGDTREQTNEKFNQWYLEQVDKLAKENILGHIHLVDSIGGSHNHVPAGEGELPLRETIKKLKDQGFTGTIVSEGYGEDQRFGQGRQWMKAWENMGAGMYPQFAGPSSPRTWDQSMNVYGAQIQPPMFHVPPYTPSNEWKLWSEIPLE
ncbi:MAG: TIM barrel protein [Candidatus Woesearchaeota archaeon]